MGCGQSKNQIGITAVIPKDTSAAPGTPSRKSRAKRTGARQELNKTSDLEDEGNVPTPKDSRRKNKHLSKLVKRDSWVMGSQESLNATSEGADSRQGSATSKVSHHSADSGFDDNDYKHVITEFSSADAVKQIEGGFETPRDLELGVVGQPVPQRYSARDRERQEEQHVIARLREEGLITRPVTRAAGGLAFELTDDKTPAFARDALAGRPALPPLRLAKLEKRKKRRRKLTETDIKAKLEKAEERRKEAEQQRLEKIQSVAMKSNIQSALDSFANMQKTTDVENTTKVENATENREKRLKEMRDKLKAKQAHAEKVRQRKQLAPADMDTEDPPRPPTSFSEDTPIRVSAEAY